MHINHKLIGAFAVVVTLSWLEPRTSGAFGEQGSETEGCAPYRVYGDRVGFLHSQATGPTAPPSNITCSSGLKVSCYYTGPCITLECLSDANCDDYFACAPWYFVYCDGGEGGGEGGEES